jgi:selenocysteine lyase/cysteine desulfurase
MSDGYFLYHSIGMYPGKDADLAQAMTDFAQAWGRPDDAQWGWVLPRRQRFIDRWQAILGAPQGSVTTCDSVTQGLHAVVEALPEAALKGRTVLVAADCFPSNHFLLSGLADRLGFRLLTVPLRQGAPWVEDEDMLAHWTPDVGLALLTWVSSTSSHRTDLAALVAHGRRMGTVIGVDLTQGAGLLPYDVASPQVDFAISTSLKWMCGTPGAGALYVAPALTEACRPALRGWFSQPDPFNWDITRFAYARDARRFESGTPTCVAALASLPALDWHAAQDHAAILAQNRALTARLFQIADDCRLPVLTPRDEPQRGGSVMLRLPDSHPASTVVAALRDKGIITDARGQTLRLSPGVLTTTAGCDRLAQALPRILAAAP